ncbi:MAG TPA: AI-2E family transporter [Ignavibacteriales bacterium]|nr:AI-2E family transporter [Ignavibacteriales bacterium]
MNTEIKIPLYAKVAQILLGIFILFYILYIGQEIIIPLVFSFFIAILLNPVVDYLCKKKINRAVAILISILLLIIILSGLGYFIISQMIMFGEMLPELEEKIDTLFTDTIQWAAQSFSVSPTKINSWISQMKSDSLDAAKTLIGPMVLSMGALIAVFLLLPVYIFLILWYKKLFLEFISKLFPVEKHKTVSEVLSETKLLIQNYLIGLLIETGIIAVLNTLGLIILGIEYAVLLGVIGALLNIIPYIGGIVAMALTMIIVLATKSPIYALWVLVLYGFVQFLDNNIIVPKIVGSKIKINEFISIIAVLLGGAVWGIPGMFLSLPIIAILKVIFDRVEALEPFGFVFGTPKPAEAKRNSNNSKRKVKESNS